MNTVLDPLIKHSMTMRPPAPLTELNPSSKDAQKAAVAFESYVIGSMLNTLFEGIPTDGLMGGGLSEHMFRSLLLEEYGKTIAQSGSLGISRQIVRALELKKNAANFSPCPLGNHYDRTCDRTF